MFSFWGDPQDERVAASGESSHPETFLAKISFLKPDVALVHATWEWPGFIPSPGEAPGFLVLFGAVALLAGAVAAVAGFGIGSILTPVLALETGLKVAVAAVGVPHLVGTSIRFYFLRRHLDRQVLFGFGIASALGGLAGALVHTRVSSRSLALVFGALLLLAGTSELTGWMRRVRWGQTAAWVAGVLSGVFGGLVGNQGSIRTAALLGFRVPKESLVATATAVALCVDAVRLPVYFATQGRAILRVWPLVLVATVAVAAGTVLGTRVLTWIPERLFRAAIALLLILLGLYMIVAVTA